MTHPVSLCLSFSLCIHTHTESSDRTALPPLPPPHLTACYFWAAKWTQMNTEEAKEGELTSCSSNLHLSTISSAVPNTHAQKLYLEPPSPPLPPSQERLLGKGRVESPHCQVPISCAAEKKLLFAKHWMCSTHTPVRNSQKLFQCASVKKKEKKRKKKRSDCPESGYSLQSHFWLADLLFLWTWTFIPPSLLSLLFLGGALKVNSRFFPDK